MRAEKVQSKAAKVGFDWPDYKGAVDKIYEETQEVCEVADSADKGRLQEEIGDLLFSAVNLARLLDVEPETALAKSSDKFIRRFDKMEQMVISENKNFKEMSLEEMDKYWDKAKQN
jgi:tetrapyrrole methylase family protein/MazG family protein